MKKSSTLLIQFVLILSLFGCSNTNYPKEIKLAYNYIDPISKKTIRNWKNAEVEEYTPNVDVEIYDYALQKRLNIKGKDTLKVTFHTKDDKIIGPIVIFLDKKGEKVLGTLGRN